MIIPGRLLQRGSHVNMCRPVVPALRCEILIGQPQAAFDCPCCTSCLYSCAHIYSCSTTVCMWYSKTWEMPHLIWYSLQGNKQISIQLSVSLQYIFILLFLFITVQCSNVMVLLDSISFYFISNFRVVFMYDCIHILVQYLILNS